MARVYPVSVPMPDLSNVYSLSKSLGRNTGYNEFARGLIEYRRDRAAWQDEQFYKEMREREKEIADAKEDAAEKKVSTEPTSGDADGDGNTKGFFEKLDNFYYDKIKPITDNAAERTIDVLSRGNYAAASAVGALNEEKETGFLDRFSDIDDAAKAFWSGLKGESKTTFAQVLAKDAKNDKEDNWKDNKWAQAGVGLGLDIVLDPTTYIGVGVISKPLKAGKELAKGTPGTDLVRFGEKGSVDEAPRVHDELSKLADEGEKLNIVPEGRDVPLTSGEIYAALGGHARTATGAPGKMFSRKAQRSAHMREAMDNLPALKEALRKDPEVKDISGTLKQIDDHIKNLEDARHQSYDQATRAAYQRKIDEFDNDPRIWEGMAPERKSLLDDAGATLKMQGVYKAIRESTFTKFKGGDPLDAFNKFMPAGWAKDPRLSDEFRQNALDASRRLASKTPAFRNSVRVAKTVKAEKDALVAELKHVDDPTRRKAIEGEIKAKESRINQQYETQARLQASTLMKITRHELNGGLMRPELADELSNLKARKADLELEIQRINSSPDLPIASVRTSHDVDELGGPRIVGPKPGVKWNENTMADGADDGIVTSDEFVPTSYADDQATRALEETQTPVATLELEQINKRIAEIEDIDNFMPDELSITRDLPDDFEVTDDWIAKALDDPDVANEISLRAQRNEESLIERELAREREQSLNESFGDAKGVTTDKGRKVRSMFGNNKGKTTNVADSVANPKVKINGKDVFKNDKEKIRELIDITPEDVAEAARRSLPQGNSETVKLLRNSELRARNIRQALKSEDLDVDAVKQFERDLKNVEEEIRNILKGGNAHIAPEHVAFDRVFKDQHGMTVGAAARAKQRYIKDVRSNNKTVIRNQNRKGVDKIRGQVKEEAWLKARDSVVADLRRKKLTGFSSDDIKLEAWDDSALAAVKDLAREEYANTVYAAKNIENLKGDALKRKIEKARQLRDTKIRLQQEAFDEAKLARAEFEKRLDEQLLLNILEENVKSGQNVLRLSFAGAKIADIPDFFHMTKATEKLGGLPILAATQKVWESGFKPASALEPELNLARLRAMSRTPNIIKHHVDDIRHRFAGYKPADRKAALKSIKTGAVVGNPELVKEFSEAFDELVPYLNGSMKVGDRPLSIMDVNGKLPEELRIVGKDSKYTDDIVISSGADIIRNLRRLPQNEDPMKVLWSYRIATEQALAEKNLHRTIRETYGVKRENLARDGGTQVQRDRREIVETLNSKHGWTTVNDLGEDYYFPPDIANDVKKLLGMMKPQNVPAIMRGFDKVTRAWKSAVTVYNPGYYTRNAIGEYMMGMFDGMSGPKYYNKAAQIIKYSMPDEVENLLKEMDPWTKRLQSPAQKGSRPVVTLKGGKELTIEDVWVLYNDQGLKSGFISSEFDHYFPAMGSLKSTAVGKAGSKVNDTVRTGGEKFEDFFRLAHFMYRLENAAGRTTAREAAEFAAQKVRKFHFDYTDFTPFEKSSLMRLFPFYKWTRKAFPLMASMLFTKPGLVNLYPKTMQNLSYGAGGTNALQDENGFYPNYEKLTPEWIKGLMAYPIGRDPEGNMDYMRMATPQMDIMSAAANPLSFGVGMLNPLLKMPLEQIQGNTLDPKFDMEIEGSKERAEHLGRITPAGSLIQNIIKGEKEGEDSAIAEPNGAWLDEKLTSFLTGLGFYENNEKRKQGAQYEQNMKGSR